MENEEFPSLIDLPPEEELFVEEVEWTEDEEEVEHVDVEEDEEDVDQLEELNF